VKYAFMLEHRKVFRIRLMCRVLKVTRSAWYKWLKGASDRQRRRLVFDQAVAKAFARRKGRYGAHRLRADLKDDKVDANRKTVAASMRRQLLRAKAAKKYKATTQSSHDLPVADNVLNRDFTAGAPNQKWVGDITYLHTTQGWLYLAVVMDLYSRMIIGWSMSERMTSTLVCDALTMALMRRKMPTGVIVHSDRGSQYCSSAYQSLLASHGLVCSMSRKGNCWDNAPTESFFHSLKVECIHGEPMTDRQTTRQTVFEYIETDYNRQRLHSSLAYLSPQQFEAASLT